MSRIDERKRKAVSLEESKDLLIARRWVQDLELNGFASGDRPAPVVSKRIKDLLERLSREFLEEA